MLKNTQPTSLTKSDNVTIISNGVKIEGKIFSKGNIRFEGEMLGDISSEDSVVVGEGANINGKIIAANIIVGGKVAGTINAKEKLTLSANGNLEGDLITEILVMEEGATFNGKSKVGK